MNGMNQPAHSRSRSTWLAFLLLFLVGSIAGTVRPLHAQSSANAETTEVWGAAAVYTWQHVSGQRAPWQVSKVLVQRRHAQGAVILEAAHVYRFGTGDAAVSIDVWQDLWSQAYLHAALDYTPDPTLLPGEAASAELYQTVAGGWEVAGSYAQRRYPAQAVHLVGAGLAKYAGAWYLRAKTTVTRLYDRFGIVQSLRARRYLDPPHEYVGLRVGGGRVAEVIDEGPLIETVRTVFVTAQFQTYVTPHLGLTVAGNYSDDAFFIRRGLTLGVLARW